eukprot:1932195-Prymnesium_polylepis.1
MCNSPWHNVQVLFSLKLNRTGATRRGPTADKHRGSRDTGAHRWRGGRMWRRPWPDRKGAAHTSAEHGSEI